MLDRPPAPPGPKSGGDIVPPTPPVVLPMGLLHTFLFIHNHLINIDLQQ